MRDMKYCKQNFWEKLHSILWKLENSRDVILGISDVFFLSVGKNRAGFLNFLIIFLDFLNYDSWFALSCRFLRSWDRKKSELRDTEVFSFRTPERNNLEACDLTN